MLNWLIYDTVLLELRRLNIEVMGQSEQVEIELPPTLSGPNWGLKKALCEKGGYNLSASSGKKLLFTSYAINELWNNEEPLDVRVVSNGHDIACVYKSVRGNSQVTPGIFPVCAYTLSLNVNPFGGGTVTKNPDKTSYCPGDQVTLTSSADSGYVFSSWSGDASGSTNSVSVTVNENRSVTANFVKSF